VPSIAELRERALADSPFDDEKTAGILEDHFAAVPRRIAFALERWPELAHEAAIGVIDADEVRTTAHPILRFTRAGWSDAAAHREFVRLANRIALRKRQQRNRPDDTARLYQLEIIKLRMQLKEMANIERHTSEGSPSSNHE